MTRTFRAATLLAAFAGAAASVGCLNSGPRPGIQARYNEYVDPCWPERYSQQAREAALNPHDIQVANARVIDQTMWNYHFEAGTAKLNANGRQRLDYLARRLPTPDAQVYLQTARDIAYDGAAPEKTISTRSDLDTKRSQAILAYLSVQPNGGKTAFEVQPIDAIDPGVNAAGPAQSVRGLPLQYRSTLNGAVGGGLQGAGGNTQFGASTFVPTSQNSGTGTGGGTGTGTGTGR